MEWSIHDIARLAGTTSRTLRHYDHIGLLKPSRVGRSGYRYYDEQALMRLQRILLLRQLGVGLTVIAEVLESQRDIATALQAHLQLLEHERERIGRQIESVRTTLLKTEGSEQLMADEIFDGFDHTQHREEVIDRWGREAYESGDRWWRSLSSDEQKELQRRQADIASAFGRAHAAGASPDSEKVQVITRRQYDWIASGWQGSSPSAEQFTALGQMYVDDSRFTATYDRHGEGTAAFIRDAMRAYADRNLQR